MSKANWQGRGNNPPNYAATERKTDLMSIWGCGIEVRLPHEMMLTTRVASATI
jgi:hypothetical protein